MAPEVRLVPVTCSVAVANPPETTSGAEPSEAVPLVKVTVPDGVPVPVVGVTVALNSVAALGAMLDGLAVKVVLVATTTTVTVTVTVPEDVK